MNNAVVLLAVACVGLIVALLYVVRAGSAPRPQFTALEPPANSALPPPQPQADHQRVEEILERMGEGVLLLDEELSPIHANTAARNLLGLGATDFKPRLTSDEIVTVAERALESSTETEDVVSMWWPRRGHLRVRATPLNDRGGVVVVLRDITEELRTQRIRREFVAHASHELKSPVAGLQTLAEAVRQAVVDDPEMAQRFSTRMVEEAERLGRLIDDLLDLSRLEDPTDVSTERIDLSQLTRSEMKSARGVAEEKGIDVSANVGQNIWVEGDGQQLSLMLRNLLDNAIRYTPSGGHIAVDLRTEEGNAVLRVIDTGIGIPREAQERVFERFYRVDRARSRDRGGTGLGLAIVKHAVELHGGNIGVESELEQGSTFVVRLPAAEPGRPHIRSVAG